MSGPVMSRSEEAAEVNKFKESCKKRGEEIVQTIFPQKVAHLQQLLDKFGLTRLKELHTNKIETSTNGKVTPGKKRARRDNGDMGDAPEVPFIPSQDLIQDLTTLVKPEILELTENCQTLKMWIQFQIPKIEDGNNFGVGVQEEVLSFVSNAETDALTFLEAITRYHTSRGKVISKCVKYPNITDYATAVSEMDEKQYLTLRLNICELRNHYSSLHDTILKNLEKIRKPRSSHHTSLF